MHPQSIRNVIVTAVRTKARFAIKGGISLVLPGAGDLEPVARKRRIGPSHLDIVGREGFEPP